MRIALVLLLLAFADEDKAIKVQMAPQDAPGHWQAQLLGELDRPVGDKLDFGGQSIPTKVNEKGGLELDLKNDGKPRVISAKREIVTIPVKGSGDKARSINAKVEFWKNADGKWVYRNLTQLHVVIGTET